MRFKRIKPSAILNLVVLPIAATFVLLACGNGADGNRSEIQKRQPLVEIKNADDFRRIVSSAGDRLLIFDFYASWCPPCKELEPILEAVAWQKKDVVDIYRINYDENNSLAELMGVHGIPFVAFVKNGTLVYSLMGLRPQKTYFEAISSFSRPDGRSGSEAAGGGIRLDLDGPPASQTPE